MHHQFINAQLLWQAQAALDAEANQPRPQASITDHPLRHVLVRVPCPCSPWWPRPRWLAG
jgi:hypothetical protein